MTAKNELRAEIEIDADPDTVWSVLMDFGASPEWNPFIDPIEGDVRPLAPACGFGSSRRTAGGRG
ncbi:MAG: SRPBCC family protein [Actinomycetota bacterium]